MAKYKIVYERKKCIGAFACIPADPDTWKQDEGRAELIGGIESSDEVFVKEVDEIKSHMQSAEMCPAKCIHIIDVETGKRII